jgi:tripartite ATP-independent transporter DctP family solute receptor
MNKKLAALFGMALCLGSTGALAQTRLTFAHHNAIGSQISNIAERFKACAEKDKAFSVAHHPAGQLGSAREVVEQLKLGAVDITVTDTAYMSNVQPELAAFQLPFLFSGWDHAERAMDGEPGKVVSDLLLKNQGVRVISFMHNGFRDVMSVKKPMTSIEDFKGVKFRSPPIPIWVRMFEALGATPVTVDWSEVYQAMQAGLADGLEGTAEGFVNSKLFEVGKFVAKTGHMYNLMMLAINERRFRSLGEKERAVLVACAADFRKAGNPEVLKLATDSYAVLEGKGVKISTLDTGPMRDRLQPIWPALLNNSAGALDLVRKIDAVR